MKTNVSKENHRPRKVWRTGALPVALLLLVAACSSPASTTQTSADTGATTTAGGTATTGTTTEGQESVLTIAVPALGTMDWAPALAADDNEKTMMLIGDNLVGVDPATGEVVGELAESWELSEDGLVWTFKLRPGVEFHDGWGTVTAEDVKFSWGEWISPDSAHSQADAYARAVGGDISGFEVVSDLEFKLHATEPVTILLALVCSCNPGMTVYPKAYYEQEGDAANAHPIGTGPWEFVSSSPGNEIVLESFDGYWGQAPTVDRVILKEVPDGSARLLQVQSGAADMAQLDAFLAGEAIAAGIQILTIPDIVNAWVDLGGSYWGHEELDEDSPWIQADNPEQGLAIRQAMSLAIDRQLILDNVLQGYGQLATAPLFQFPSNPNLVDDQLTPPEYDPDLARQKLAEGGYPDGFEVTMPIYSGDIDTASVGEAIAGMWEEIGLTVTRQPTEEGTHRELERAYTTDGLAWVRLSGNVPEMGRFIRNYVKDLAPFAPVTHERITEAWSLLSVEPSVDERYAITRDLNRFLRENEIGLTLFTGDMLFAASPRIASWDPMPGINTVNRLETITLTD